jgi:hypothetical protein
MRAYMIERFKIYAVSQILIGSVLSFLHIIPLFGVVLHVGPGQTFATVAQAAQQANPGDTILIHSHTYPGGNFIGDLHGTPSAYITFLGVDAETVIFQGGVQALHFSQVSYIRLQNISITGQTGNGINIDDAGTFDTPSHHIEVTGCRFYDMGATGNHDFLKMSGVDHFLVTDCTFENGATGGSGIDMVGCHHGYIGECSFWNMGSNCIQAKGGTQFISIARNYFENGGVRALNLGGSTGLEFFRPQDAPFEAADLDVYANVFVGGWAPIAYVGCVRVHVVNNTIIQPENWIIRILQETVDPDRFLPCGDNSFVNNLVYFNNSISTHVNIGSNTAPETFVFSHNLWYNHADPADSEPNLPVPELGAVVGIDPLMVNVASEDYQLTGGSPAVDAGMNTSFTHDHNGDPVPQGNAVDIGAFEFPGALSAELIFFRATSLKDSEIFLEWMVSNSLFIQHFELMRSETGKTWERIAVISAESSNNLSEFSYTDMSPVTPVVLYRLHWILMDGIEKKSTAISIQIPFVQTLVLFPNPVRKLLSIRMANFQSGDTYQIRIIDITGRQFDVIEAIDPYVPIDVSSLIPGIYQLQIRYGSKLFLSKFHKVH